MREHRTKGGIILASKDGRVPESRKNAVSQAEGAFITEARAAELIVAGVATSSRNIYEQLAEANSKMFEQLEQIVTQRVLAELEQRTLVGRVKRRIRQLLRRPPLTLEADRAIANMETLNPTPRPEPEAATEGIAFKWSAHHTDVHGSGEALSGEGIAASPLDALQQAVLTTIGREATDDELRHSRRRGNAYELPVDGWVIHLEPSR